MIMEYDVSHQMQLMDRLTKAGVDPINSFVLSEMPGAGRRVVQGMEMLKSGVVATLARSEKPLLPSSQEAIAAKASHVANALIDTHIAEAAQGDHFRMKLQPTKALAIVEFAMGEAKLFSTADRRVETGALALAFTGMTTVYDALMEEDHYDRNSLPEPLTSALKRTFEIAYPQR